MQGRTEGALAREPEAEEAPAPRDWRRERWVPWAVSLSLVLLGFAIGYIPAAIVLRPAFKVPVPARAGKNVRIRTGPDRAQVLGIAPAVRATAGEQVTISWTVANTGESTWTVDGYRFVPADAESTPVLALGQTADPGEQVEVRANLTPPADFAGTWTPSWTLTGPKGPVPGGELRAQVEVTPPEP